MKPHPTKPIVDRIAKKKHIFLIFTVINDKNSNVICINSMQFKLVNATVSGDK